MDRKGIFQKAARKKTYSRRKPRKKESLLASDEEEPLTLTNVEDLLKDDSPISEDESDEVKSAPPDLETIKENDKIVDPLLPPLVDSKDNMDIDPAISAKEEREAIKEARKLVAEEEGEESEPVRRSKRQKKKTPKMRIQEAAVKSKSKPHASKTRNKRGKSAGKKRKASITEVSEGTAIRLFWEPTQTWSNGIVVTDWKDGYFTIEFEDDVKEQGALSYKLAEYEWFILEDVKSTSKKGRKRKRKQDGDYTDEAAAAPVKRQRTSGSKNDSALEEKDDQIKTLEKELRELKNAVESLQNEKTQYESEKAEITKLLDTIELKEFKSTNVMEKLKHILTNYKAA